MKAKTVLITGAAGGLGQALATLCATDGMHVVLTDRPGLLMPEAATTGAEIIEADLCDAADLTRLCERLEHGAPAVDLLINNAGIGLPGSVADIDSGLLTRHVDINLTAPMRLSQAAARRMKMQGHGQIFSIVSLAGLFPLKDSAAYTASKFGLRGFMAALSLEIRPHGVQVGGLFPSAIDTPMLRAEMAHPEGSPLNFAGGTEPLSAEETAKAVMKAIKSGALETWLPASEGRMAGLVMAFPSLLRPVFSYLERQGNKKKRAYIGTLGT